MTFDGEDDFDTASDFYVIDSVSRSRRREKVRRLAI